MTTQKEHPILSGLLFFQIYSKECFIYSTDRIVYTTAVVTPVLDHWLEREIAKCDHQMGWTRSSPTSQKNH